MGKKIAKYTQIGAVILGILKHAQLTVCLVKAIIAKGYIEMTLVITSLLAVQCSLLKLGKS